MKPVTITTLVENTVNTPELQGEHGLSLLIETPHGNLLWDTGQSGLLMKNAAILGKHLENIEHIALSHGHYDHTGGLLDIVSQNTETTIYAHPGIFTYRVSQKKTVPDGFRSIGIPVTREALEKRCRNLHLTRESCEILPGIFTTGEIPRTNDFEDVGGPFYLDDACTVPDPIIDDQSLVIDTDDGLIVLLGCCHSGVVNTLKIIASRWNSPKFLLIAGGMHLVNASSDRVEKTIEALRGFEIQELAPGHCTGWQAACALHAAFPSITRPLSTGWSWPV